MRAFDEEALLERSRQLGEQLMQRLRALQREHPRIADVRGLGAMVAFELFDDRGQPDAASTSALVARAAERGLLLLSCGSHGNVVRILVPITAAPALIEEGMAILQDCL